MELLVYSVDNLTTHSFIAKSQAQHLKQKKEEVTETECVILLDFAENYHYVVQGEIQGYDWNKDQCTMHPVVIYFKKNCVLHHISLYIISDDREHDTCFVHELERTVMIYIKEKLSQIKIVYYFHDDCAEQYKNYKAFLKLYHDKSDFNIDATWAFFAASYGKSPSDGVGSTVKCKILHASLQRPVNNQILMFHAVKESWKSSIEGIFLMIDKVAVRENLKPWYCCWYYESPPLCPNISIYH